MLKKTIRFFDLDENPIEQDYYFNFSVQELIEMELEVPGGMKAKLEAIVKAEDVPAMMGTFKDIILRAVGQKSADNIRFVKTARMREDFYDSPAYGVLFFELISEAGAAASFMNALMPKELMQRVEQIRKAQGEQQIEEYQTTAPEERERTTEDFTLQERVDMSEAEFDRLYGTNPKKWTKTTMVAAMRRHTSSGREEV